MEFRYLYTVTHFELHDQRVTQYHNTGRTKGYKPREPVSNLRRLVVFHPIRRVSVLNKFVEFNSGKSKRSPRKLLQYGVVTKRRNDLQPPKTTYNHLKPPTTIYNHLEKFNNHLQPPQKHLQPPTNNRIPS